MTASKENAKSIISIKHFAGIVFVVTVTTLVTLIFIGYINEEWTWTGLHRTDKYGLKTLWHWLDLLIIPTVIAIGAWWFKNTEAEIEQTRLDEHRKLELELAESRAQEAAFETYLDRMSNLLLDKENPLSKSSFADPTQNMARTRTLSILRRLSNVERRNRVIQFLRDAGLLGVKLRTHVFQILPDNLLDMSKDDDSCGIDNYEVANRQEDSNPVALLVHANLGGVDLERAFLHEADMSGANLYEANLKWTFLQMINLESANLESANLFLAMLEEANMKRTNLFAANLEGANLSKANLSEAELIMANLSEANLFAANLEEANLQEANMFAANLEEANLFEADLSQADLRGAKNLTCEQLMSAKNWNFAYRDKALACGASIHKYPGDEDQEEKQKLKGTE